MKSGVMTQSPQIRDRPCSGTREVSPGFAQVFAHCSEHSAYFSPERLPTMKGGRPLEQDARLPKEMCP